MANTLGRMRNDRAKPSRSHLKARPVEAVRANLDSITRRQPPDPNSEGRNPKEGRIPKAEATLGHFGFRISAFFRSSDFGLRVWAFALTGW